MAGTKSRLGQIPRAVWVLGFVSLLMDVSSEMIHSRLPLFMVTTLGVSTFAIGLIEGLVESTALRGGAGISDTGISGFLAGHNRRVGVHEEIET